MQFTDQMQRTIMLPQTPKRIISLVPSQSELLWDLGLQEELIGITKFCIHPQDMFRSITRIGGTKTLDIDKIRSLKPDLIIGNKEENEQSQIKQLMNEFTVWMSDINTYEQSLDMIKRVGELTDRQTQAGNVLQNIEQQFALLDQADKPSIRVLYLIWRGPYMAAGTNTFIHDMLQRCGFTNCMQEDGNRYPELSLEEIAAMKPDHIFLSSEPYPFKENHITELQTIVPRSRITLVDGELFSWYGSRLQQAPAYFKKLIADIQ